MVRGGVADRDPVYGVPGVQDLVSHSSQQLLRIVGKSLAQINLNLCCSSFDLCIDRLR